MELLDRLKTAPYGAFAIDLEQNIIFWNPRAERILGFEPRQVLGRKCHEVLQGLALEGAIPFCTRDCPAIAAAREGHIPAATQARMQCASGERKQVTIIPLIAHDDQDRTVLAHMFHETPVQGPCPGQGEALAVSSLRPWLLDVRWVGSVAHCSTGSERAAEERQAPSSSGAGLGRTALRMLQHTRPSKPRNRPRPNAPDPVAGWV